MIATAFKALVVAMVIVALFAAFGLFVMAGIAATHDVVRVPIPTSSYLTPFAERSNFSVAYRAPLEYNTFKDINQVAAYAFFRAQHEIARSDSEVVYSGARLDLHYFVSYILGKQTSPPTLTVVTVVRFRNRTGRYVWEVLGRVHHRLVPYLLDRMAQLAPE
jgi:hypothetical protein